MMQTTSDMPKGKTNRMMQVLDEHGRPVGQYIHIKQSVLDKIADLIGDKPSVTVLH